MLTQRKVTQAQEPVSQGAPARTQARKRYANQHPWAVYARRFLEIGSPLIIIGLSIIFSVSVAIWVYHSADHEEELIEDREMHWHDGVHSHSALVAVLGAVYDVTRLGASASSHGHHFQMHGPLHYLVTTELVRSIPRISHAAEEERDPLKRHEYVPQSAEEIAAMPIDELRIVAEWRHHFRSTCRYVGKHVDGLFYTVNGTATETLEIIESRLNDFAATHPSSQFFVTVPELPICDNTEDGTAWSCPEGKGFPRMVPTEEGGRARSIRDCRCSLKPHHTLEKKYFVQGCDVLATTCKKP